MHSKAWELSIYLNDVKQENKKEKKKGYKRALGGGNMFCTAEAT